MAVERGELLERLYGIFHNNEIGVACRHAFRDVLHHKIAHAFLIQLVHVAVTVVAVGVEREKQRAVGVGKSP